MEHCEKSFFDVNDFSFAHLTLIVLLHYLVKCWSHTLVADVACQNY